MNISPDQPLKCLLVYPEFSEFSFWNFKDSIKTTGAKAITAPLGLLTVAALTPQYWQYRLEDLNVSPLNEDNWQWADIILVSGMLPQQKGMLAIIDKANRDGKYVVVGGPNATSQPKVYQNANALVLNEGEITIPMWIESWRSGRPNGTFSSDEKADITKSPIPRYDLVNLNKYYSASVQFSRGCPFTCEFCDIIELFGRKPRQKTSEQFLNELSVIYDLGFRGAVDIVDDNFIANKRIVKRDLLPALIEWNNDRKRPFYYQIEASMNAADDKALLSLMAEAQFFHAFLGIETPNEAALKQTKKLQNVHRTIKERVEEFYKYGILVSGGFILGFDAETKGMDKQMIRCIEQTGISIAMVGLLTALPGTQLMRRLVDENRLENDMSEFMVSGSEKIKDYEIVDQTISGLNFVTLRPRLEILEEYLNIVTSIYSAKNYFKRTYATNQLLKFPHKRRLPDPIEIPGLLKSFFLIFWGLLKDKDTRWLALKYIPRSVFQGAHRNYVFMSNIAMYLHFKKQANYLRTVLKGKISAENSLKLENESSSNDQKVSLSLNAG